MSKVAEPVRRPFGFETTLDQHRYVPLAQWSSARLYVPPAQWSSARLTHGRWFSASVAINDTDIWPPLDEPALSDGFRHPAETLYTFRFSVRLGRGYENRFEVSITREFRRKRKR